MNIVVDTNVFISALIRDGITRHIIVHSKDNLIFPEFELVEINDHKEEIIKKANLTERQFNIVLLRLLKYVRVIPTNIVIDYRDEAFEIMKEIDKDDTIFIATALAFNALIWSDDSDFKKQNKIKILTTKELINLI